VRKSYAPAKGGKGDLRSSIKNENALIQMNDSEHFLKTEILVTDWILEDSGIN